MNEEADRARGLAAEAAATWIQQYEGWDGALVTGYILILEAVPPNGVPALQWMTGNGAVPTEDNREPLTEWRARGMLGSVISELDGRTAEIVRRQMEEE